MSNDKGIIAILAIGTASVFLIVSGMVNAGIVGLIVMWVLIWWHDNRPGGVG